MAPEVGIAPTSPPLQRGANLPQILRGACARSPLRAAKMVVPRRNAPRSLAYKASALLLSYETMVSCGLTPNRFDGRNTMFTFTRGRMRMTRFGL